MLFYKCKTYSPFSPFYISWCHFASLFHHLTFKVCVSSFFSECFLKFEGGTPDRDIEKGCIAALKAAKDRAFGRKRRRTLTEDKSASKQQQLCSSSDSDWLYIPFNFENCRNAVVHITAWSLLRQHTFLSLFTSITHSDKLMNVLFSSFILLHEVYALTHVFICFCILHIVINW